ncbi:uncharacterized protein BO96DRAFT_431340 [Aspergillus niger CBS 101883]|uniref:uncharacterized protein n=1 Tax=Aspergillus lacticoffeatus (strain CBS 101883) TaxID=1450533 RepID=UPI000D7EEE6A|nr:uncharacterized protein BO96DRAFT_431340 [Aspergillus niger CBS 101883]PYH60277.1 hypothetical protein BO96DRAFT_431340 [Aspergillus niger CBS 101883]
MVVVPGMVLIRPYLEARTFVLCTWLLEAHPAEDTFDASAEDGQIDAEMDTIEPSGESRPEKSSSVGDEYRTFVRSNTNADVTMSTARLNEMVEAAPGTDDEKLLCSRQFLRKHIFTKECDTNMISYPVHVAAESNNASVGNRTDDAEGQFNHRKRCSMLRLKMSISISRWLRLDDMGRVEVDAIAHSRSLYLLEHPQSILSSGQTPRNTVAFTDLQQVPSPATPLEGHATSDIWAVVPEAHQLDDELHGCKIGGFKWMRVPVSSDKAHTSSRCWNLVALWRS